MKKLLLLLLIAALGMSVFSCVPSSYSEGAPELTYDRLYELKDIMRNTLDNAVIGEEDDMYPKASYDALVEAFEALKKGIAKARAGVYILQFEVDNYVKAAEKALALFEDSKIKAVAPGTPAELFVHGVDHKGYIDFGSSPDYNPVNFTVETWTKHNEDFIEFTFGSFLSTFISPIPYKGWSLHYWGVANSLLRLSVGTDNADVNATLPTIYTASPTNWGEWFHIAGVFDTGAKRMSLYIDGELKTYYDLSDKMVPGTTEQECRMWAFVEPLDHSRCVSGYIKKFRLWSSAKSQQEIKDLMKKDVTGNESGLVCAWDFTVKPDNDEVMVDKTGKHSAKLVGVYKWSEIK